MCPPSGELVTSGPTQLMAPDVPASRRYKQTVQAQGSWRDILRGIRAIRNPAQPGQAPGTPPVYVHGYEAPPREETEQEKAEKRARAALCIQVRVWGSARALGGGLAGAREGGLSSARCQLASRSTAAAAATSSRSAHLRPGV